MNNFYRKVFNAHRGCIVAVDETKSAQRGSAASGEGTVTQPFKKTVISLITAGLIGLAAGGGAYAAEERVYDLDKTSDFGYTFIGPDGESYAFLSTYGGPDPANPTSVIDKDVRLITLGSSSGAFMASHNAYLSAGHTMSFGSGTFGDFLDKYDEEAGAMIQTNFIVRGLLTSDAESYLNLQSLILDDAGKFRAGGWVEGETIRVTDSGRLAVEGGSLLTDTLIVDGGSVAVTSGFLGVGPVTLKEEGTLTTVKAAAQAASLITAKPAVLALDNRSISLSGASLQVGTLPDGTSIDAGDAWFGSDSALILNALGFADTYKGIGQNGTGTLTVKNGSELIVTGASWGLNFVVADNFGAVNLEEGAWAGSSLVNRTGLSGSTLLTSVGDGGKSVYLIVTESQTDRHYDITKTDDFGYTFIGPDAPSTGALSTAGNSETGNNTSIIDKNVTMISDGSQHGMFFASDNAYLAAGSAMTFGDGTYGHFLDYTDDITGETTEMNLIVRGTLTGEAGSQINASNIVLDKGTMNAAGTMESSAVVLTKGSAINVTGGETLIGKAYIEGGSISVTGGYLGFSNYTPDENGEFASVTARAEAARLMTAKSAILELNNRSLALNGATLQVGSIAQGDDIASGDVYFGADSALIVNSSSSMDTYKGITSNGAGKMTVRKGSELIMTGMSWGSNVIIADNFSTIEMDRGAWSGSSIVNRTTFRDVSLGTMISDDGKRLYLTVTEDGGSEAAPDPNSDWGIASLASEDIIDADRDWQGYYWGAVGNPEGNVNTVWVKPSTVMTGGVYTTKQQSNGTTVDRGAYGNSGRAVYYKAYIDGTLKDAPTWTNAAGETLAQTGSVYWFSNTFVSRVGKMDVSEVRASESFMTKSTDARIGKLYGSNSVQIGNDGAMTLGDAYLGLTNSFTNHALGASDAMTTLTWDESATGLFKNGGDVTVTGTLINTIAIQDTSSAGPWTIGTWDNRAKADLAEVTVTNLINTGEITAGIFKPAGGTSSGTLNIEDTFEGTLSSSGKVAFTGNRGTIFAGGTLTNTGALEATSRLSVTGGEIAQSGATAAFTSVTLSGGKLGFAEGTSASGSDTLTVSAGELANSGSTVFAAVKLTGGTVSGTGTLTAENGLMAVSAGVSVTQGAVSGLYSNAGTVSVSGAVTSTGRLTNETGASLTAGSLTTGGVLENSGSISSAAVSAAGHFINNVGSSITGRMTLETEGDFTNAGTVGSLSEKLRSITAAGKTQINAGSVYADTMTLKSLSLASGAEIGAGSVSTTGGTIGGKITASGAFSLTGDTTLEATSDVNASGFKMTAGTVTSEGKLKGTTFTFDGGSFVTTSENLTFTNLNAASGTNYRQNSGTSSFGTVTADSTVFRIDGGTFALTGTAENTMGSLTVNAGTVSSTSSSLTTSALTNRAAMTLGGKLSITGASSNTGSVTAAGVDVAADFTSRGSLDAGSALTVKNGATAQLIGATSADTLQIEGASASISSADTRFKTLRMTGSAALTTSEALAFQTIEADSVTYNQTGGTVTSADGSFFTNSSINLSGGTLVRTAAGSNTLGSGNTYTLSGSSFPGYIGTSTDPLGSNWKDGQTVVSVGLLDSESSITVGRGAVLEASGLALTSQTLTIDGGAFATNLKAMFDGVTAQTYRVTDGTPGSIATDVLGTSSVSNLRSDFESYMTFGANGGTLVITDKMVVLSAITSANDALRNIASAADKDVNVVFTGGVASGASGEGFTSLSLESFEALKAEQNAASDFQRSGLVFSSMTFSNRDRAGGTAREKLVVGDAGNAEDTYYLDRSIGFSSVIDTENVTVKDGRTLVLAGLTEETAPPVSEEEDAPKNYSLIGTGGAVTVTGENSKAQLGTAGVSGTQGVVKTAAVTQKGTLAVSGSGLFTVETLSLTSGGKLDVGTGSNLVVNTAANEAGTEVTNHGALRIESSTLAGKLTNAAGATATFANGLTMTADARSENHLSNSGALLVKGASGISGAMALEDSSRTVLAGAADIASTGSVRLAGDMRSGNTTLAGRISLKGTSLLYADTLSTTSTSKLLIGPNSTLMTGTLRVLGNVSFDYSEGAVSGTSIVVGSGNVSEWLGDAENAARVAALVDGTSMTSVLSMALRPLALTELRSLLEADENGRHFDIAKSEDFGYRYIGPEGASNGFLTTAGTPENPTSVIDQDVTLVTDEGRSGTFSGTGNVYLEAGRTMHFAEGTKGRFSDHVDTTTGDIEETNFIVRGTVEADADTDLAIQNLVLAGGSLIERGRYEGDILHIAENGRFTVEGGDVLVKSGRLEGGALEVKSGIFAFSDYESADTARSASVMEKAAAIRRMTDKNAVLMIDNTAVRLSGTSLLVGTMPERSALGAGDVFFGSDSALIVDANTVADNFRFIGGSTGTFTVASGSELIVTGASYGRNYLIADGFDQVTLEEGAWSGDTLIDRTDLANIALETAVSDDGGSLFLVVRDDAAAPELPEEPGDEVDDPQGGGTERPTLPFVDISRILPGVIGANIINPTINDPDLIQRFDSDDKAVMFLTRAMNSVYGIDKPVQTKIVNSVLGLGAASGFGAYALTERSALLDSIEARTTAKHASGLWAEALARESEADGTRIGSTVSGWEADTTGFIFGGDIVLDSGLTLGTAFSYAKGDIDSTGGVYATSTDAEMFGFSVYAAKDVGPVKFSALAGWTHATGDVTQQAAPTMMTGPATAKTSSDAFHFGLRADVTADLGFVTLTPHAGVRLIRTSSDDAAVRLDGGDAFRISTADSTHVEIPLGLRMASQFKALGIDFTPHADLAVHLKRGDRDEDMRIRTAGAYRAETGLSYETAGSVSRRGSIGIEGKRDRLAFSLSIAGESSSKGRSAKSASASVKVEF